MIMENNNTIACNITIGKSIDIDTIAQFQMAMAMESEGTALDADKVHRGVTAAINDSNKGTYIIAKIGNKAVGSLMLTREWSDWNNCWYWWVQSVYVLPQYRGKGIYRAMYAHVKQLAKEQHRRISKRRRAYTLCASKITKHCICKDFARSYYREII